MPFLTKPMKIKILFLIGIAFIILLGTVLQITTLSITQDKQVLYLFPVKESSTFSIRWIHSVEKEEWEEFFILEDNHIFLDATRFKTFGAGVPNDIGKDSFIKNGWLYMVDINRFIGDELYIRTGNDTNHRLIIDEKTLPLSIKGKNFSYLIQVEKYTLFKYLYNLIRTN